MALTEWTARLGRSEVMMLKETRHCEIQPALPYALPHAVGKVNMGYLMNVIEQKG